MTGATPRIARIDLDEALAHAREAARALDGSSLFITGGTGFFGRWLLALLAHARAELGLSLEATVLSRRPEAYPDLAAQSWIRLVPGDVRSFEFPSGGFTHVVHAATDTSVAADRDPRTLIASIVDGTARVLDLAAASGARRLLYVSSGAVYGAQPPGLTHIPESFAGAPDPLDPRSSYGQAKRIAEQLCTVAAGTGLHCVIARAFAFVGPGLPLDAHFAIGNFIRDALHGQPIVVGGDGTPLRSYLYAGDLAAWLTTLLVRGRPGEAYNVGSDQTISIGELAGLVGRTLPGAGEVVVKGSAQPGQHRSRYVPSIDKARHELGLDTWTPLATAISRTAAANREGADAL